MPLDIATLGIAVDSRPVAFAEQSLNRLTTAGGRAEQQVGRLESAWAASNRSVQSFLTPLRILQGALLGLGTTLAVQKLIQTADTFNLIQARLNLVSETTEQARDNFESLFEIAQETRTSFEGTGELFARVARFGDQLGVTNTQLLAITRTIQQAIVVSGASMQEAQAGVIQFSQALASGVLRGDEARSVLENMPRLARAIADGMGITFSAFVTQLKNGGIVAQDIIDALLSQGRTLQDEFEQIPPTIGQAFQVLNNAFGKYIADADDATSATQILAEGIIELAENFEILADITLKVGGAIALLATARAAGAAFAAMGASVALVSGPIRAIIAGAPLATVRLLALGSAARVAGAALAFMGGWVGLAVTGIGLLAYALWQEHTAETATQKVRRESADILGEMRDLTNELATAEGTRREEIIKTREELIKTAEAELAAARAALTRAELAADPQTRVTIGGKGGGVQVPLGELPTDIFGGGEAEKRHERFITALSVVENLEGRLLALRKEAADTPDPIGKVGGDTGEDKAKKIKEVTSALESYIAKVEESAAEAQLEAAISRQSSVEKEKARAVFEAGAAAIEDYNKGLRDSPLLYDEERAAIERAVEIRERYNEAVDHEIELDREAKRIKEDAKTATEEYAEAIKRLRELLDSGRISQAEFNAELERLNKEALEEATDALSGLERGLDRYISKVEDQATTMERGVEEAFEGAEDALTRFVTTGEAEVDRLFGSILGGINKLLIQELLLAPLARTLKDIITDMNALSGSGAGTGSIAGDLGNWLGNLVGIAGLFGGGAGHTTGPGGAGFSLPFFGGPRQHGGPVSPYKYYLADETSSAPGLFFPMRAGRIDPGPPAESGRRVMIRQQFGPIITPNPDSFRASEGQILKRSGRAVQSAMRRIGR